MRSAVLSTPACAHGSSTASANAPPSPDASDVVAAAHATRHAVDPSTHVEGSASEGSVAGHTAGATAAAVPAGATTQRHAPSHQSGHGQPTAARRRTRQHRLVSAGRIERQAAAQPADGAAAPAASPAWPPWPEQGAAAAAPGIASVPADVIGAAKAASSPRPERGGGAANAVQPGSRPRPLPSAASTGALARLCGQSRRGVTPVLAWGVVVTAPCRRKHQRGRALRHGARPQRQVPAD
mmetsp:Transcript_4065/g.17035  ORF Transcript_4065/g.17035 Transcript_4065/m.17035 type:complete len:239 (+) Transcript_4065:3157-3873(+)